MMIFKKVAAFAATASVTIMALTGCSGDVLGLTSNACEQPKALAIVLGNHLCSKELNLSSPVITDLVSETVASYGYISVISVDGSPSVEIAESYDIPDQYKNAVKTKLESDAEKKGKNLLLMAGTVKADDPEVDTLSAIRLASRSLLATNTDSEKTMIVVDTGWSTTGLMDFSNNLLSGDPEAIAQMLFEKDALPDLRGVKVFWLQMGDVAAPEKELSPSQVKKLSAIWKAVIEKAGGSFVLADTVPNNAVIGGSLPEVRTIDHESETPVIINTSEKDVKSLSFTQPLFFSEDQVKFMGDSDEYVDENAAMESIRPVAEYMEKNKDFSLLLIGTTAGDGNTQYSKELSSKRAQAVKKTLVGFGIEEERIITSGLGSADKWHIYGAGTTGALAAQNRKVVLLDASSKEAQELIGVDERR